MFIYLLLENNKKGTLFYAFIKINSHILPFGLMEDKRALIKKTTSTSYLVEGFLMSSFKLQTKMTIL